MLQEYDLSSAWIRTQPLVAETVQAIIEKIEMTCALVEVHPILIVPWLETVACVIAIDFIPLKMLMSVIVYGDMLPMCHST